MEKGASTKHLSSTAHCLSTDEYRCLMLQCSRTTALRVPRLRCCSFSSGRCNQKGSRHREGRLLQCQTVRWGEKDCRKAKHTAPAEVKPPAATTPTAAVCTRNAADVHCTTMVNGSFVFDNTHITMPSSCDVQQALMICRAAACPAAQAGITTTNKMLLVPHFAQRLTQLLRRLHL